MANFAKDLRSIRRLLPNSISKKLPREVKIVEAGPEESKRLNRVYRKVGRPTNVLSFNYGPGYGEIMVAPGVIRREARRAGNSYRCQLTWMILHGMLHLAGLHHEKSKGAERRIANLEKKILKKIKPCAAFQ